MGQSAPEVPSHRRTAAWLVPIAVTCIALYFRQLFLGQTFVLRDHLVYTWPERKVLADCTPLLRAGAIVSAFAWLGVLALFCGMRRRSAPSVVERPG